MGRRAVLARERQPEPSLVLPQDLQRAQQVRPQVLQEPARRQEV